MHPDLPADMAARLLFGGAALLYLALRAFAPAVRRAGRAKRLDAALVLLGVASLLHYLELPPFAPLAERPAHIHDLAHYWLGAKYFPETGYERMYVCLLDATGNDFGAAVARDLRDKRVKPVASLLSDPALACRPHFSAQRWAAYTADVRTMRAWAGAAQWRAFVQDFGFNPPPTWLVAGYPLANAVELTTRGVYLLTALDPLLLALGLAVAAAAFGPAPAALAALGMTSFFPASASWTIGSLLRWDWLFWLFVAVAAARRDRLALAGAAFGLATAIRIFPVSALVVVALYAALRARAGLGLGPPLRFLAGFAAGVASIVAVSLALFGLETWPAFVANVASLGRAYGINFMGLRTTLTFAWSLAEAGEWYPPEPLLAELKQQAFARIGWAHAAIALGSLALVRRFAALPPWIVLLGALAWIPFSWAEIASYYFMYWGALFLLASHRAALALPLALCNVASVLLVLGLGRTPHLYAALSVATCAAVLAVLVLLDREAARSARRTDSAAPGPARETTPAAG